jgi:hypothetical protein
VVAANGIVEGGKPNKGLLRTFGALDTAINYLPESENWSTGCGAYAYWDKSGRVAYAIAAGDPDKMPAIQRCIVTGILNGFGLRSGSKEFVASPEDYPQYLLLARAITHCDGEVGRTSGQEGETKRNAYVDCIANKLKAKLTE